MTVARIAQDVVIAADAEIDGKTLTVPALLVSDDTGILLYAVDVDVGQTRVNPNSGEDEPAILKNCTIANGDQSVLYADVGAAVRVRRSASGRWEVTGFSKRLPGTFTLLEITIGDPDEAPIAVTEYEPVDLTMSSRILSYDELATFGGYGVVPYGAYGVFRGDELVELRS